MATAAELILLFKADASGASAETKRIQKDIQAFAKEMGKIGDSFVDIGAKLTGVITVPLAGIGAAATKMAADFDLGLRKVGSLIGGLTDNEFKDLHSQVLNLSSAMGIDAVKATDALYEAISAGVPKENAVEFLAVASKAAIAGVTDTKVAVDGLTTIINAYGLSTKDAAEIADAMFQAVNLGKFQFADLAASMSIAIPIASTLGVGFKDVLAAAATLTAQGFSVSEAMTSITQAMNAIVTPNKVMNELLERTGTASGEALIKTKGFQGAIEALREASHGNNEELINAYGRVQALGAALKLTGDGAGVARQHLDSVRNSMEGLGAATVAFNEINKSSSRQFDILIFQIKAAAIEFGAALLPAVNSILQTAKPLIAFLADAARWFAQLPEPVRNTAIGLAALAAAVGPVLFVTGQLISSFSSVTGAIVTLSKSSIPQLIGLLTSLPSAFSAAGRAAMLAFVNLPSLLNGVGPALSALKASLIDISLVNIASQAAGFLRLGSLADAAKSSFSGLSIAIQNIGLVAGRWELLTNGELALLSFGAAAVYAATAFATWKLAEWAYANFPPFTGLVNDTIASALNLKDEAMKLGGVFVDLGHSIGDTIQLISVTLASFAEAAGLGDVIAAMRTMADVVNVYVVGAFASAKITSQDFFQSLIGSIFPIFNIKEALNALAVILEKVREGIEFITGKYRDMDKAAQDAADKGQAAAAKSMRESASAIIALNGGLDTHLVALQKVGDATGVTTATQKKLDEALESAEKNLTLTNKAFDVFAATAEDVEKAQKAVTAAMKAAHPELAKNVKVYTQLDAAKSEMTRTMLELTKQVEYEADALTGEIRVVDNSRDAWRDRMRMHDQAIANAQRGVFVWNASRDAILAEGAAMLQVANSVSGFTGEFKSLEAIQKDLQEQFLKTAQAMTFPTQAMQDMQRLGVPALQDLQRKLDEDVAAYNRLAAAGLQSGQALQAEITILRDRIAIAQANGEKTAAMEHELERLEGRLRGVNPLFGEFGNQVSTAFTDFAKKAAEGEASIGDLADTIKRILIEGAMKPLGIIIRDVLTGDFIGAWETIKDAAGGVVDIIKNISSTIAGIFGEGGSAIQNITLFGDRWNSIMGSLRTPPTFPETNFPGGPAGDGSVPGTDAGVPGTSVPGSGGGGGSSSGGGAAGWMGWVNVVTGAISAISNVISNFQAARQEGTLNAIEMSTRIMAISLLGFADTSEASQRAAGESQQSIFWFMKNAALELEQIHIVTSGSQAERLQGIWEQTETSRYLLAEILAALPGAAVGPVAVNAPTSFDLTPITDSIAMVGDSMSASLDSVVESINAGNDSAWAKSTVDAIESVKSAGIAGDQSVVAGLTDISTVIRDGFYGIGLQIQNLSAIGLQTIEAFSVNGNRIVQTISRTADLISSVGLGIWREIQNSTSVLWDIRNILSVRQPPNLIVNFYAQQGTDAREQADEFARQLARRYPSFA